MTAAMQQDDVRRQSLTPRLAAVEDFADRVKRLLVGEMSLPAHDPALQKPRSITFHLHLHVVVALQRHHIKIIKMLDQLIGNVSKISGITNSAAEAFEH